MRRDRTDHMGTLAAAETYRMTAVLFLYYHAVFLIQKSAVVRGAQYTKAESSGLRSERGVSLMLGRVRMRHLPRDTKMDGFKIF